MMAAIAVLVAAAAAVFVLAPLRRPAPHGDGGSGPGDGRRLDAEAQALARAGLAQALRDLELDRATGKLNEVDYQELAARYRGQALAALGRQGLGGDEYAGSAQRAPGPEARARTAAPLSGSAGGNDANGGEA